MIERLAKEYVHPILKKAGFRKRGLLWTRFRKEFFDVVRLQSSRFSNADKQEITGNLGIFVPEFFEVIFERPCLTPNEADCCIEKRLGFLREMKEPLDYWWELEESTIKSVGEEFVDILQSKGVPFLESVSDFKSMAYYIDLDKGSRDQMIPYKRLLSAMVRLKIQDYGAFEKEIAKMNSGWDDKVILVRCWAERLKQEHS